MYSKEGKPLENKVLPVMGKNKLKAAFKTNTGKVSKA